jgi:hypothetical protein
VARIIGGIIEALDADPVIHDLVNGGLWDRPLRREGPNATPDAFEDSAPYLPRNSIAVIDAGETPDPASPECSLAVVNIWVRVPDSPAGVEAQSAILSGCIGVLGNQIIEDSGNGEVGLVEVQDRFPGQLDPWVKGGRMAYLRLRVAGLLSGLEV